MEEAEEEQREAEGAETPNLWRPRSVDPCEKERKQSSARSLGQVEQREDSDDKKNVILNFQNCLKTIEKPILEFPNWSPRPDLQRCAPI